MQNGKENLDKIRQGEDECKVIHVDFKKKERWAHANKARMVNISRQE